MLLTNKIKCTFLLVISCINTVSRANLADWMQDRGVRGMAYASQFAQSAIKHVGSMDPRLKFVAVVGSACLLFKGGYVQQLIKEARTKKEKKKIKDSYWFNSGDPDGLGVVMYTATAGAGIDYHMSALNGEHIAKIMAQNNPSAGVMCLDNTPPFLSNEKAQIEAGLSQMGLNPSKFIVIKEAGDGGSVRGTSEGGIIALGENLCKDPKKLNAILGHEAVHLKKSHAKKSAIAGVFIPIGVEVGCRLLQYGTTKLIQKLKRDYRIKKNSKTYHVLRWTQYSIDTATNSYLLKSLLSFYLLYGYFRSQEKEADLESARQLKSAKDSIDYFEDVLKANMQRKEQLSDQNYDNQGNYLGDLTHPYLTERIAYLKPLAQEQASVA